MSSSCACLCHLLLTLCVASLVSGRVQLAGNTTQTQQQDGGGIPSDSGTYSASESRSVSSKAEAPSVYSLSRAHVFQTGYDHINLLLLKCLTRSLQPLSDAGPFVKQSSMLCVRQARERLDAGADAIESIFATTPEPAGSPDPKLDEDIAVIQQGLDARERFPASDVIEQRALHSSYSLPRADPALAPVRHAFVDLEYKIWDELSQCLRRVWEAAPPASARPVGQLYKCIEHRVGNHADENAIKAGIPPAYVQELQKLRMKGVNV